MAVESLYLPSTLQQPTILHALDNHALEMPDKLAFVFLADGENESDRLTYSELRAQSLAVMRVLRDSCNPGDRALLLYPVPLIASRA